MEFVEALGRQAPDYRMVVNAADKVLVDNVILEPPVELKEIVENAGLTILFADFPEELSNVMGFYDLGLRHIVVNRADPPNRQRFTVAHEFGHSILHRELIENHPDQYKVLLRQPVGGQKDPVEQEANAFAANLLVPRRLLSRFAKVGDTAELARLFIVSEDVIRWRLVNERLAEPA